jgi:capsular exopolysaccharide synthesis family protein
MNSFNLIQTLRGQEATTEAQLASDSSKYGAAYPKLADERASLASIRQQIKQEVARIGERAANDYRSAQTDEDQLRQSYNRDRAEASKINDKAMEYTIARQEASQAEQLYQTLYQRMKQAGVVQGLPATNITVVDPARVPGRPVKPNVPVYLAASIFAGLFLGSVAAFFLDTISDKVQVLKPVAQELHLPCLGALPSLAGDSRGLSLPGFGQKFLPRNDEPANSGRLAIVDGSSTAFSEALRSVRTTIQLARNAGSPAKVILVTSSVPREGKSTVSSNLAAAFAQSGEDVLLIEGDLRQPSFAARLDASTHPDFGLSSLLQQDLPWKDSYADKVADVPGLRVLYAGPTPQRPAELLASTRMASVLEQVKSKFDRIVIDSPPLLPVTDAAILSHFSDMTLLIVRDDLTTLKALNRASEILAENNASEVGLILNGVSRSSLNYEDYCAHSSDSYYQELPKASRA